MKTLIIRASCLSMVLIMLLAGPSVAATGLASTLAMQEGMKEADAAKTVAAVFHAIEAELTKGHEVKVRKFGRFYLQSREARKARNPKTGAVVMVPAKKYPKFRSSDSLKKAVNSSSKIPS